MGAHKMYSDRIMSHTIPPSLHEMGYEGIAAAVVYVALLDIVTETYARLERNAGRDVKYSQDYSSAVKFFKDHGNPLYRLEIPGEELAKKFIRRAEYDWKRRNEQRPVHGRDGSGRKPDADGQSKRA